MEKFCVFCGNKPKDKNNEHIIPKWLIELTGDPNRVVQFGPIYDSKTEKLVTKNFAFDQFQFPACESCNTKYSDLELKAKDIVEKITNEKELNSEDFSIFLDWMDKIRVGLWLAYNYLQKNLSEINPNYHISKRIGTKDRLIFIYKSDSKQTGISFSGIQTPAFQYHPTCFYLRINQFCFFNISTNFVISKHLGLPYSKEMYYTAGQEMKFRITEGKNRISYPLLRMSYNRKCTEIYQPIYSDKKSNPQLEDFYKNNHAETLSKDFKNGIGKILIATNNTIKEYPLEASLSWIPKDVWNLADLVSMISKQVFEAQLYFLNRNGKYNDISLDKKTVIKEQIETAKAVNRIFLELLEEGKAI